VHNADVRNALARDVLAAHVRALMQDNAVQIASLDTHTVKPWFAGRLEFAPAVKDLSAEGFALAGGRLDYVGGRRVAALVYRRRLHQVSVFVWPADGDAVTPSAARLDGYNLVSWQRGGMTFWAVSDLNEGELRELQSLL
jgi:anti-sigma factor RsiW